MVTALGRGFFGAAFFLATTLRFAAFLPFLARLPARAAAPVRFAIFFLVFFAAYFPFLRPGRLDFALVRAIKPPVLRG